MGVLQRFGISYLVCASLHVIFYQRHRILPGTNMWKSMYDVLLIKFEWLCAITYVGIYLLLTFAAKPPDCPRGYLGPGGKYNMAEYPNCAGGIAGYVDKLILTENHMYQHSSAKSIYNSPSFDPEGIFGCLLSIVQVIIGLQCGITLITYSDAKSRIYRWLSWAFLLGLCGGLLCSFSKEDGLIPVNKNLWSLSFVCITSCFAFIALTICYFLIDVKNNLEWYTI